MKQIMTTSNLFLHTYVVVSIHILVTSVYCALQVSCPVGKSE